MFRNLALFTGLFTNQVEACTFDFEDSHASASSRRFYCAVEQTP
jgi:hypothetical protein